MSAGHDGGVRFTVIKTNNDSSEGTESKALLDGDKGKIYFLLPKKAVSVVFSRMNWHFLAVLLLKSLERE